MAYWITPTGHDDPDSAWSDEAKVYDENTGTCATTQVPAVSWSSFLELTIHDIVCSAVRFYATHILGKIDLIDLDVYRDGAWVDVYDGAYADQTWVEKTFTEGTVTKARARFRNSWGYETGVQFFEFDFWGTDPPTKPTLLECETATNPMAVTDLTPEFTAIGHDPKPGDTLTHAQIQVGTAQGTADMWDSDWLDIADFVESNRCAAISYAGPALSKDGKLYYWRIRFKDAAGTEGVWSCAGPAGPWPEDVASFRMLLNLQETLAINATDTKALTKTLTETLALSDDFSWKWFVHCIETLALSDAIGLDLVLVLAETLGLDDGDTEHIHKVFSENLALADELGKALTIIRSETLALKDKLRLGGLWDDPTTKAIITILKVLLSTAVRKDEVKTSIRKDVVKTSVRKDVVTAKIPKVDLDIEVR